MSFLKRFVLGVILCSLWGQEANSLLSKVWLENVKFQVAPIINGNAPVRVCLVIVYDDDALGALKVMPADDFFKQEEQLRKDYADKVDFFGGSDKQWEFIGGQVPEDKEITMTQSSPVGGLIFAQYDTAQFPGDHRETLTDEHELTIHFEIDKFWIEKIR
jgi:hypothetical protein